MDPMFRKLLVLMLWLVSLAANAAGLDVYLVRHAETQANASGIHNTVTSGSFSEEGEAQIRMLTNGLAHYRFDAILVSPTERTLYTIAPYLLQTGRSAEIWPEIAECCWQKDRMSSGPGALVWGDDIRLPVAIAPQFVFRTGIPQRSFANRSYADGVAQVRQAADLIRQRYGHSGKSILLVLHYHSGAVLMAELLDQDREQLPHLKNARLTHLRQDDAGQFHILTANSRLESGEEE
jgi:broad specificity phosphatase PhoE